MSNSELHLRKSADQLLSQIIQRASGVLGNTLRSAVLFGSGAEGRLRPTSDLNLIFVLRSWQLDSLIPLRDELIAARAASRLNIMFLNEDELEAAAESFAVKFWDLHLRHRILYGEDLFASLKPSRGALITRLQQVLLNLTLRLRSALLYRSGSAMREANLLAESAGPLRAAASALLHLEGKGDYPPREALERLVKSHSNAGKLNTTLEILRSARGREEISVKECEAALSDIAELAQEMQKRAKLMFVQ